MMQHKNELSMTKEDWLFHQKKIILEEYMETFQNRELGNETNTINGSNQSMQARERASETGAVKQVEYRLG